MKKILTLMALVLGGLTATAQTRTIDLKTVLLKPVDGTVINCTDSFPAAWLVINGGPDPIYPTDTVGIADYENLFEQSGTDVSKSFFATPMTDTVFAGDTLQIDGLSWNSHYARIKTLVDTSTGEFVNTFVNGRGYLAYSNVLGVMKNIAGAWQSDPNVTDPNDTNNYSFRAVIMNCGTGIKDAITGLAKQTISVYPNPANRDINFEFEFLKAANASARISDITGRTVLVKDFGKNAAGIRKFNLDISALNAGTYFLELVTDDKRGLSKFTVQK
ncbi:T9SS type A sorting domain-containing protein [Taibaiella chishuiensis]|uniref:Putative secreted protein (Por secretion system target) n=1 Tax=Taibaiella chishuiensis TaxID=1434707 RepID=A0A2P8DAM5_9BACT|nr:T9SS type A sorting domain-containing protein [Taibaiella chishuiensis]PSK94273.1 putative secreted protein (Por secretion system target) [Taibaiella chishuiensis]